MDTIEKLLEVIDKDKLPAHIAIIMDGNGRWAQKRNMPRSYGHFEGTKRVVDIVRFASNMNIQVLSLFAFSTENWKRPVQEVNRLMFLMVEFINNYIDELAEKNVHLRVLGDISVIPDNVKDRLNYAIKKTESNTGMTLNIALNYGSQQEILMAVKAIAMRYNNSSPDDILSITPEEFEKELYTSGQPYVDLMIRPSGELRLSNFLMYQAAYAELYFSNILWPDFNEIEFLKAIKEFQNRNRRFGGL